MSHGPVGTLQTSEYMTQLISQLRFPVHGVSLMVGLWEEKY